MAWNKSRERKPKKEKISKALIESVIKTFEDMAFLDVESISEVNRINFNQIMYINILNPLSGGIAIYLPNNCKKNIIENIYSEDMSNLLPKEIDDCLLEILNVIAGSFLGRLYKSCVRYRVDIPRVIFDESGLETGLDNFTELCFDAEGDRFKVAVAVS